MAAGKEMRKGTGKGGEILGGLSWSMAVCGMQGNGGAERDQHGIERSKMSLCVPVHPQGKRFREKEKSVWSEGNKGREISRGFNQ